jgi:hypothetical protein
VFPVRYELDSYILFRGNSVVKGLNTKTQHMLVPENSSNSRHHRICNRATSANLEKKTP